MRRTTFDVPIAPRADWLEGARNCGQTSLDRFVATQPFRSPPSSGEPNSLPVCLAPASSEPTCVGAGDKSCLQVVASSGEEARAARARSAMSRHALFAPMPVSSASARFACSASRKRSTSASRSVARWATASTSGTLSRSTSWCGCSEAKRRQSESSARSRFSIALRRYGPSAASSSLPSLVSSPLIGVETPEFFTDGSGCSERAIERRAAVQMCSTIASSNGPLQSSSTSSSSCSTEFSCRPSASPPRAARSSAERIVFRCRSSHSPACLSPTLANLTISSRTESHASIAAKRSGSCPPRAAS